MNIIFLGSVKFSKTILETLIKSKKKLISGVIGGKKAAEAFEIIKWIN